MPPKTDTSGITFQCCDCNRYFTHGETKYVFCFGLFAQCKACYEKNEDNE